MKLTILGCGPSGGVPLANGDWGKCDPQNPKNSRTRSSVFVEYNDKKVIVDCSVDLRQQAIREKIPHVDAVLCTHEHSDHIMGVDDLKNLCYGRPELPLFGEARCLDYINEHFSYLFKNQSFQNVATPVYFKGFLSPQPIEFYTPFDLFGVSVLPFPQNHGTITSVGYKFDHKIAYSTDVVEFLDDHIFDVLKGIDVWIIDCLRLKPHETHAHLEKTLSWIERVKPKKAILTHMTKDLDYNALKSLLPSHVEPAYDGMVIEV